MRKYQVIWEDVKKVANEQAPKNRCVVEAHRLLHPRIRKAVIKEKHADLGFKVMNHHDRLILHTEVVNKDKEGNWLPSNKWQLVFFLKASLNLKGVVN